jgi:hypothetical protein
LRIATFTLAAATTFILTAAAVAEEQPPTSPPNGNEMVCRQQPSATGSRLGARRVCMTQREWQDQQNAARDLGDQAQSSALRAKPPGS